MALISRRQIIDLRDTDKSRYFAITVFNNCFIIRSPSWFFNEYPREPKRSAIFTQERSQEGEKQGFHYACAEYYLQPVWFAAKHFQTQLYGIAHKQTIICRQLFAAHLVGSRPMKRKKKLLRIPRGKYDVHVRTLAMNSLGLSLKLIPICLFSFFFFFSFFYDNVFAILSTS